MPLLLLSCQLAAMPGRKEHYYLKCEYQSGCQLVLAARAREKYGMSVEVSRGHATFCAYTLYITSSSSANIVRSENLLHRTVIAFL